MENEQNNNEISDYPDENNSIDEELDENEEVPIVEVDVEPPEKYLDETIISNCISMLCKTSDGMNYAYVQLYSVQKAITDISILSRYTHLRYINLSSNNISDLSPFNSLNDLITLDCSTNRIATIDIMDLPYLQRLNLSNNRITTLDRISFPLLETLNLNGNRISSLYDSDGNTTLQSERLPELINLELRGNHLTDTSGLEDLSNVKNVFLSKNKIEKITELTKLINLTTLHLRDNQITELDGFTDDLQSLQYLNIRGNQVENIDEIRKLKELPLIRALVVSGNQVAELDEYRLETLIALRKLVRLDKDNFLDEERTEAEQIYTQRLQDEMLEQEKSMENDTEE